MAKAVLIMDMPECCADCRLSDCDPGGSYCLPVYNYYDGSYLSASRASFCPLRELPKRKETIIYENDDWRTVTEKERNEGFNACLDKISK